MLTQSQTDLVKDFLSNHSATFRSWLVYRGRDQAEADAILAALDPADAPPAPTAGWVTSDADYLEHYYPAPNEAALCGELRDEYLPPRDMPIAPCPVCRAFYLKRNRALAGVLAGSERRDS